MKIFAFLLVILALASSAVACGNPICSLKHSADGNCTALIPSWTYKAKTNKCIKFTYGGCGGNANRFETREQCEDMCKE